MFDSKLRFYARGIAMVQAHHDERQRRYIGRRHQELPDMPGRFASVPTGEAEEVPFMHEYAKACADGDLWPADKETAAICSAATSRAVVFDSTFGGEVTERPKQLTASGSKEKV